MTEEEEDTKMNPKLQEDDNMMENPKKLHT